MGFLSPRIVLAIVHTHRFLNKATNTDTRYTEAHYSSQTSLYRWSYIAKLPPPPPNTCGDDYFYEKPVTRITAEVGRDC